MKSVLPSLNLSKYSAAFHHHGGLMNFSIEHEQEEDGRWLAEVPELPGVLAYGATADEAMLKVEALALRVIAERLEQGESRPIPIHLSLAASA
jgi:predicted RNase H-like HicB family nuclease